VEERGGDRARAEAEFREDLRDGQRVRDVRLAAPALLARVCPRGRLVCALDDRDVAARVMHAHRTDELLYAVARGRAREQPRHEAPQRTRRRGGARRHRVGHPVTSAIENPSILRLEPRLTPR
jgi:hypothetical protein